MGRLRFAFVNAATALVSPPRTSMFHGFKIRQMVRLVPVHDFGQPRPVAAASTRLYASCRLMRPAKSRPGSDQV